MNFKSTGADLHRQAGEYKIGQEELKRKQAMHEANREKEREEKRVLEVEDERLRIIAETIPCKECGNLFDSRGFLEDCDVCGEKKRNVIMERHEIEVNKEIIRIEKEREERAEMEFNHNYFSKIPPKYREAKNPDERLSSQFSLLFGKNGTGKTWQAYAELHRIGYSQSNNNFLITTAESMIGRIRSDYAMSNKSDYLDVDILVIDELEKIDKADRNMSTVSDIIHYRHDWEKKTILICNAKSKEYLYKIIPISVLDRFRHNLIEMSGKSRR